MCYSEQLCVMWHGIRCRWSGPSRESALRLWHRNRTQPHREHSIWLNYLQRLELNALRLFQGLMEEVIRWAICVNVGRLQRLFSDHWHTLHSGEEKDWGLFTKQLINNYNFVLFFLAKVFFFLPSLTLSSVNKHYYAVLWNTWFNKVSCGTNMQSLHTICTHLNNCNSYQYAWPCIYLQVNI